MLTIGSLFSGIGGLDLGLERAGVGRVIWQCEADAFCRSVLAKHWPSAHRFEDVCILGESRTDRPVRPDILAGGFPCQGASEANPRGRGLADPRTGLWFEFERLVGELEPAGVVVENVSRLARRGLDTVADGLARRGYRVEATRIRASDVGAPHIRERLFLVAVRAVRAVADADHPGEPREGLEVDEGRGRPVDGDRRRGRGEAVADAARLGQHEGGARPHDPKRGRRLSEVLREDEAEAEGEPWATPAARDWRSSAHSTTKSAGRPLSEQVGLVTRGTGPLNPSWVEALMGFPPGWTALETAGSGLPPGDAPLGPGNPPEGPTGSSNGDSA